MKEALASVARRAQDARVVQRRDNALENLFAKQCAPSKGSVAHVHGIPPFSARVVQREPSAL
jgi:hypothetical protein